MTDYRIRQASADDAAVLAYHRVAMMKDLGELTEADASAVELSSRVRITTDLAAGGFVAWLAEVDGHPVAGAGIVMHPKFPHARNPRGRPTAHVLNVFTEPDHRRRGLASRLVSEIFRWCRDNDIPRVSLHASPQGRPVYERLGFLTTNEMQIDLR